MKEYLIVDGYNIIGAWPELAKLRDEEDMAYARDKLIEELNVHAALSGVIITVILMRIWSKEAAEPMKLWAMSKLSLPKRASPPIWQSKD